jgi:hypothetical protein
MKNLAGGSEGRMADSTDTHEAAAELRITRVKALSNRDLVAMVTYLLARHPDTFPPMLDDALSSVSPKQGG